MKHFLLVLFILSYSVIKSQPSTFKLYRNGKEIGSALVDVANKKVTKVIYNHTRIKKSKKVSKPVDLIQYKIVEVFNKPTALDTLAILQKYYTKNVFKDVLVLEKEQGTVVITDTVAHNRLVGRAWTASIQPRVVKEIVEVNKPSSREYFIGSELATDFDRMNNWYGLNLLIKNKSNSIIKFGTGLNMRDGLTGPKPFLVGGYYFKIK